MKTNFVQAAKKIFSFGGRNNDSVLKAALKSPAILTMATGAVISGVSAAAMAGPEFLIGGATMVASVIMAEREKGKSLDKLSEVRENNGLSDGFPKPERHTPTRSFSSFDM